MFNVVVQKHGQAVTCTIPSSMSTEPMNQGTFSGRHVMTSASYLSASSSGGAHRLRTSLDLSRNSFHDRSIPVQDLWSVVLAITRFRTSDLPEH